MRKSFTFSIVWMALAGLPGLEAATVALVADPGLAAPAASGLEAVERSLGAKGFDVRRSARVEQGEADFYVVAGAPEQPGPAKALLEVMNVDLPDSPEALAIRRGRIGGKPALVLYGADARGLMYAAFDAADRISWSESAPDPFGHIEDIDEKPYIRERAVSIYTMQRRYFESRLYDEAHWRRYFDQLARSRINSFVVIFGYENGGFLAPSYPYFFNVEGFPDVKMVGLAASEQERNRKAFQRMIDIAHERGVDFSVAIWDHIYRGGVQGGGIAGASELAGKPVPGLVWGVTAENLAPYTKAGLKKFMQTFPEIDGLQFRMHGESGLKPEEMPRFWHEVFAMIRDFKPEMRVDIRAKELPDSIIDDGLDQGLNLRVTTKYWMEQTGLPFHPTHINTQNQDDRRHGYADLLRLPQKYKVHWRLWNGGTTRMLLWADPEFVRRFAESARLYDGDSYEVNEMLATKMLGEPHDVEPKPILNKAYQYYDYEFERYWHYFEVWGRVGYNPDTNPQVWQREFQSRFGEQAGVHLMKALHSASWVLPRIVTSSYRYRWFPTTRGWAETNPMDMLPDYIDEEGSDIAQFMNVGDQAKSVIEGGDTAMRRPAENSRWFADVADGVLRHVRLAEETAADPANREFVSTTTDLKILANLARYHSRRLLSGVQYALYKETGDLFAFDDAIELEGSAIEAWADIVAAAGVVYRDDLALGVERVGFARHWKDELDKLREGLRSLKQDRRDARLEPGSGGPAIAHTPLRRAGLGEPLKIRATIAAAGGLSQAHAVVREGSSAARKVALREVAPAMYEAEIENPGSETVLSYVIEAAGQDGKTASYPADGGIRVRITSDRQPPEVQLQRPAEAVPGKSLRVRALAHDPSGVASLRLRYRHLTQFEDYKTAEMRFDPAGGVYEGEIPGEFITADWNLVYYVEALDKQGNGRIYPDLDQEAPYVVVETQRGSSD